MTRQIVFARYTTGITSSAAKVENLTYLDGTPLVLEDPDSAIYHKAVVHDEGGE